ncbi:hypothetical protein PSHT_03929 [Puccinia striiformis]|uniref:Uncharacterized protein n=1 Tax=Puccinia striiformis TaxID=27350 RepID=A0A2S4WEE4_9BASI|nr:hypothetical protein PSHT_03929 [Puccinia striiformis]
MGKMGETDSSQPKENQAPPSINVRPDAPHKYHQLTHHLYPSPHPKIASPHNPHLDSNLSYNLKYCRNTRSTSRTVPVSKKNRASQKLKKTASRKRHEEEEEEEEEEEINHCEGRPNEENLDTNFTLGNFKSQLPLWSIQKLRDVLAKRKKACSNRVYPNVQEALVLLQQNYIKSILMLSLLGRISENTTAKFLGENKPSRKKSNWNRLVAFSVTSEQTPFPPKGWEEHNVILGEAWENLSEVEKEVFEPKFFNSSRRSHLEEEDDGGETVKLTQEEDECYRPLYEKLAPYPTIRQAALSNRHHLNFKDLTELFTITNLYNSTYCILTSSRAPGVNSFCHEYSNDVGWLAITKSRWASKETFEAYSQAREMQEVLEKAVGVLIVKKISATNALKGKL